MTKDRFADDARRIVAAATTDDTAYRRLEWLCDRIGARLSGSKALEQAVAWSASQMRKDGFDAVREERVKVPRWVRGKESAFIREPISRPLTMLGLGGSVGTGGRELTAPVLVVSDFDELDRRGREAEGRIVCFNVPFTQYGATVAYRSRGAGEAAKRGAVGVLVRSVGPESLSTPHTGSVTYPPDGRRIPAAAITIEDATLLARNQARGENSVVSLRMGARTLADTWSANVVADLRGREKPDEVVLLGAHLDSWDVGQGAHDDGGGCVAVWEAARLLKELALRPRRTVRVVLFTNEENGLRGGRGYAEAHRDTVARHVLVVESDSGVTDPKGVGLSARSPEGLVRARETLEPLLSLVGAGRVDSGGGGADIGPLGALGVPTMGIQVDMSLYWSIHHTPADTFEKVEPASLARCVAVLAMVARVAGEIDNPW